MGSLSAMKAGSAARFGHDKADTTRKVAAEGIEALKEVSGSVDDVLATLIGGVQSGMGYLGAATLPELRAKARYIRVSPAGKKEAAPDDVIELTRRAPTTRRVFGTARFPLTHLRRVPLFATSQVAR